MKRVADEVGWEAAKERWILTGATAFLSIVPIALLLAPAPLAVLIFRHGLRPGIIAAVLSSMFASLITLNPAILAQVLLVLALGVALGEALRDGFDARRILIMGTAVAALTTLLLLYLVERVFGISPFEIVAGFWESFLSDMASGRGTLAPDAVEEMRRAIELQVAHMRLTFPASLAMGSLGLTVVDLSLTRWLLDRMPPRSGREPGGSSIETGAAWLPPFARWALPRWIGLAFLGAQALELIVVRDTLGLFGAVVINAALVLRTLVTVEGASVAWFFLARTSLPKGIRLLLFAGLLLFLHQLASLAFLGLGLVDMAFDTRRLRRGTERTHT